MTNRQMSLGAFFMFPGHHVAAWRDPSTTKEQLLNIEFIKEQAKKAEAAKFDAIFLADGVTSPNPHHASFASSFAPFLEPFTLLSALASVTEKIGLVGTVSTTFTEPFNVARQFASLDIISNGRAGWNVVTSNEAAGQNFDVPYEQLTPEARYARAEEYVDVTKKLWTSIEEDAIVYNRETNQLVNEKKVHVVGHAGKHFNITGPLTIPQSKQGHPVIVQAGSSEPGRELAARTAEAIFTAWQSFEDAQAFYQDVKSRLAKYGRRTDELKILPGIFPVVGRTFEEAQAKHQQLLDYIPVEAGIARLSALIGFDLSSYNVDGYLPQAVFDGAATGHRSRVDIITKLARDENLTIRQLYQRISGGRGHYEIVGTPEYIADVLQHWFEHEAADGFNILAPTYPQGFDDFIELVLPELQRRGLFRTAYSGSTLREHFGLQKPVPVFL